PPGMRRIAMSERAWTRLCVLLGLFAVALCTLYILQYTRFPYEPYRLFIFGYLLRIQDLPAAALVGFIVLAAALPRLSRPGFALLLAPFVLLGIAGVCNAALTSGSFVLIAALARRLIGSPAAAGWAFLLALASPAFTGMALGYFSMPAHLFLNLLFAWLLLER